MDIDLIFKRPIEFYERNLDPVASYIEMSGHYVSRVKDIPLTQAKEHVRAKLKSTIKNPVVEHSYRAENGDREKAETSLHQYLTRAKNEGLLLAPTFTCYTPRKDIPSMFGEFMEENIAGRSVYKKLMFKAKSLGDTDEFEANNLNQKLSKLLNNSASGAFAQNTGVLSNPTSHSTLTSVTRSITSIANTSNEKMIYGNRYYPTPEFVLNNCVYLAYKCDEDAYRAIVKKYSIHIPSVEECIQCLRWSSDLYFRDEFYYSSYIRPYLEKLTDEERCTIVYSGDLYHFAKHNRDITLSLLLKMCEVVSEDHSIVPEDVMKMDGRLLNLVHFILFYDVKGHGTRYNDMDESLLKKIAGTAKNAFDTIFQYQDLFHTLFINDTIIQSSQYMRQMLRRSVVLSDTDSTCFSVDNWVIWAFGKFVVNEKSIALAGAVGFICNELTGHLLKNFSVTSGVETKYTSTLSMKNEFMWTAHLPTQVGKHYIGLTVMQEGNVFDVPELEVKGVHLLNSTVPRDLIQDNKDMVQSVLQAVSDNRKVNLKEIIDKCKEVELKILEGIKGNNAVNIFKKTSIKDKTAYSLDEHKSPYQNHSFWMEVFYPKYKFSLEPAYRVCKIPTTMTNKRQFNEWIETLPPIMKEGCLGWLERHKKDKILTFYVSVDFMASYGIPEEMFGVIDTRRVQLDLTNQYRLSLEALGVMLMPGVLISEQL